jgi:hypothetical protein
MPEETPKCTCGGTFELHSEESDDDAVFDTYHCDTCERRLSVILNLETLEEVTRIIEEDD